MEVDTSSASNSSSSEEDKRRHKHKSKKHKEKKSKKHKKSSKRRKRYSTSSSSDNGSSSSEEEQWVEAKSDTKEMDKKSKSENKQDNPSTSSSNVTKIESNPQSRKKDDDDEWSSFGNILPTFSNDSKRTQRQNKKEEERQRGSIDKAGQHENELNPYWKDGGKGLPAQEVESIKPKAQGAVGDGGLAWLKKSFERAKQQAKEDGKSLEEVVSLRWGSLEAFYELLEEAESKANGESSSSGSRDRHDRDRRKSFKKPSRYSDSEEDDRHSERRRYSHDRESSKDRHGHHRDRHNRNDRDRESDRYSRGRDHHRPLEQKTPSWKKPGMDKIPPQKREYHDANVGPAPANVSMSKPTFIGITEQKEQTKISISSRRDSEDEEMDDEEELKSSEPTVEVLTDKEMNELNAKLFKAEMLGNTEQIDTLKNKIQEAEKQRQEYIKDGKTIGDKKPTKVIIKIIMNQNPKRRIKDKPTESHKSGERVRYFPDDDRQTLKSMFEREKLNTVEDENALFSRLITKGSKATEDYDVDDIFVDKASSSRQEMKDRKRELENVLYEEKAHKKVLEDCQWCFDGNHLQKNLVISIGQSSFLCVPPYQSLTEGHCLIVPMFHVSSATQLDEDVWAELKKFQTALVQMFRATDQDVVFFESALYLKKQPHMYIECVPMPKETGELAPIYFKKAIQECETEWSQNKKVVDLKNRDVRRAIPKGLPYFSVEFADDNCGFAHVVEDEQNFPKNFAQEIIGGMLELDHHLWRKQKKDDFQTQRNKLMAFLTGWGPYDWTRNETS